jgi:polar amino acid transport system ATP-binding protein
MVKIRGVRKSYNGVEVLKGVDLNVDRGEVTCLIGPSGSGKSTLLRCINHLEKHDSGELRVDSELVGYEMRNGRLYELTDKRVCENRSRIGMVFQRFNLFQHLTVLENVTVGQRKVLGKNREDASQKARELLARVGLKEKETSYPSQLSGGQQQRVAIARALVNKPSLLLADEPTGNLDSQTSIEIMGVFQKLNDQGITIVMVTHELDIARYTKRMVVLRDGKIVTDEPVRDRSIADAELRQLREAQQAVKLA